MLRSVIFISVCVYFSCTIRCILIYMFACRQFLYRHKIYMYNIIHVKYTCVNSVCVRVCVWSQTLFWIYLVKKMNKSTTMIFLTFHLSKKKLIFWELKTFIFTNFLFIKVCQNACEWHLQTNDKLDIWWNMFDKLYNTQVIFSALMFKSFLIRISFNVPMLAIHKHIKKYSCTDISKHLYILTHICRYICIQQEYLA